MTWKQIKEAVEKAGVNEDEEITEIHCENANGDHSFQKIRLGRKLRLAENVCNDAARSDAEGCAV